MSIVVVKLGGSILRDVPSYESAARDIRERGGRGSRVVAVVSARFGETDELLELAASLAPEPDAATLDLLWSTGEIRSAATLTLCLHALGVRAVALDVHQAGLRFDGRLDVDPRPLRRALEEHEAVIVPGFLAAGRRDAVVTLGRGGSDLSAVAIAAALGADACELWKDVPGYFTADPRSHADARHLPQLDYERALRMAAEGCDLVQDAALAAARDAGLTLVVRAAHDRRQTLVRPRTGGGGAELEAAIAAPAG